MNVFIVYREDGYGSYSVRKIFMSYDSAASFVNSLDSYEVGLHSIEEDIVEE